MRSRTHPGYTIIDACRNGLHCGIPYNILGFGCIKVYELNLGFEFCLLDEALSEFGDAQDLQTIISSDDEEPPNQTDQNINENNTSSQPTT